MVGETCPESVDEANRTRIEPALVRSAGQLFTAYIEYMKLMFGNLFLLNAGSATALIAYLGTYKKAEEPLLLVPSASLKQAIIAFACGAVLAVIATLALAIGENINAHRVERAVMTGTERRYSTAGGWIAGLAIAGSGLAFLIACLSAIAR